MEDVLKYLVGLIPWALANMDGSLKKTSKAALAQKLETFAALAEHLDTPPACIIDGMSMVQNMKGDNITFEELSHQLLTSILKQAERSQRIVSRDQSKPPKEQREAQKQGYMSPTLSRGTIFSSGGDCCHLVQAKQS